MGTVAISSLGKMPVAEQTNGKVSAVQKEEDEIRFVDMMSQMTQPGMELFSQEDTFAVNDGVQIDSKTSTNEYDRYQYRENGIKTRTPETGKEITDETTKKLDEFAGEVTEVLKEELGVTDEQILEAMNVLGITFADLVDSKQLVSLVAELTGCQDMSALLCDGSFMTIMQSVATLSEDLLKDLGMTGEELTQLFQQMQPEMSDEMISEEMIAPEQQIVEAHTSVKTDAVIEAAEGKTMGDVPEEQLVTSVEQNTESDLDGTQTEIVQTNIATEMSEDAEQMDGEGFSQQEQKQNGHQVNMAANENVAASNQQNVQVENTFVSNVETVSSFSEQIDVENIIRQIAEFSRVTIGNAQTTLEMQLNPENLGKLYLEVTSKEGNVSAHITVQNDMVKEALETQLVELRQSMNQAGVKVDAVEVTVGSHEFEKNLEQNAKQQEQQAEQREQQVKRTRHINLNDLSELSGIMTEEESLVARMMADQGNSVDFTA